MNKENGYIDINDRGRILFFHDILSSKRLTEEAFEKLKNKRYVEEILGGIYIKYREQLGNTLFHGQIANDFPKQTLRLLRFIDDIANKNGKKLNELIPFTAFEDRNGKIKTNNVSNIGKNFLMLAIAKKYDNSKEKPKIQSILQKYKHKKELKRIIGRGDKNVPSIINEMKQYGVSEDMIRKLEYDNLLEKILLEDSLEELERLDPMTLNHKDRYQKDDAELINWLINKAPKECLQQKDSEKYNLADYALMKMDLDILNQLLEKEPTLLKSSRLYYLVLRDEFTYQHAEKLVAERYDNPTGIADEAEWCVKKKKVIKFLQEKQQEEFVVNKTKEIKNGESKVKNKEKNRVIKK